MFATASLDLSFVRVSVVFKQRSIQAGIQSKRRLRLRARQLPRDELDRLTRLYETLTKPSPPLTARTGPEGRRRGGPFTGPRRRPPSRKHRAQSFSLGVPQQAIKYAALALVIAASFVLGLNSERFSGYAAQVPDLYRLAIYHLSGQADADKRVYEEQVRVQQARMRQEQDMEMQRVKRAQEIEVQDAKEKQVRLARIEQIRATTAAWQEFLSGNRDRFKQIELISDQQSSDYNCLRIRNILWDFVSPNKRSAELARQKAEVSTYRIRDAISDEFIEWLNADHVLERTDWKYADLQHIETEFSAVCLSPDHVSRSNRYSQPIDTLAAIIPAQM